MRIGTTPTHNFRLPFGTETIRKVRVLYAQNDAVIFKKEDEACTREGNTIKVQLTQDETLLFDYKKPVQIQLRVLTSDGEALTSQIVKVWPDKCLESEVFE